MSNNAVYNLLNTEEKIGKAAINPLGAVVSGVESLFTPPKLPNTPAGNAAAAAYKAGYKGSGSSPNTISGSAKIGINNNLTKVTKSATDSLVKSQTGGGSSGPTTPPATNSAGTPSSTTTTAAYVDPVISGYTTQYSSAVSAENTNYSTQINDANATFLPVYNQTKNDQSSAVAAAGAAYDAQNPHASAEERAEYLSVVGSSFDNNLAEMAATHQTTLDGINQNHSANLLNLQDSFNSSVATQYQQNFTNLNTEMTTNPPNVSQIGSDISSAMASGSSLEDAISSSPTLQPYLQLAMSSGQFPTIQAALQYIMNPTLGEQKLSVSQQEANAATENASTSASNAAGTSVTTPSSSGIPAWIGELFGNPISKETVKTPGVPGSSSSSNSSTDPLGLGL